MSDLQLSIHHNQQSQRFETTVDGTTAYISYVDNGDVIVYDHTICGKLPAKPPRIQ